jgi:hypothetical protein
MGEPQDTIYEKLSAIERILPYHMQIVMPQGSGPLVGRYWRIDGSDAPRIEARLTKDELECLFCYWAQESRGIDYLCATVPRRRCHLRQKHKDASRRLRYLGALLGGERSREIYQKVEPDPALEAELDVDTVIWDAEHILGPEEMRAIRDQAWQGVPTEEEVQAMRTAAGKRVIEGFRAALAAAALASATGEPEQPAYEESMDDDPFAAEEPAWFSAGEETIE